MNLRNDHTYGETYEAKRLRLRSNTEDPRPGLDHDDDPFARFDPATDAWPSPCALPDSALAGSRSEQAAPRTHDRGGAAAHSVVGGLGGSCSPTTPPSTDRKAA